MSEKQAWESSSLLCGRVITASSSLLCIIAGESATLHCWYNYKPSRTFYFYFLIFRFHTQKYMNFPAFNFLHMLGSICNTSPYLLSRNSLRFSLPLVSHLNSNMMYFCEWVGWVVDDSRVKNTSKTKSKIVAINAIVAGSVYFLDSWLVHFIKRRW